MFVAFAPRLIQIAHDVLAHPPASGHNHGLRFDSKEATAIGVGEGNEIRFLGFAEVFDPNRSGIEPQANPLTGSVQGREVNGVFPDRLHGARSFDRFRDEGFDEQSNHAGVAAREHLNPCRHAVVDRRNDLGPFVVEECG